MTTPLSDIEGKLELAAVYHLNGISSKLAGITIHPGVDGSSLTIDHIVARVPGLDEAYYNSGLYKADLEIEIVTQADDATGSTHRQRVGYVRDEFQNSWVGISMSSQVSGLRINGVEAGKASQTQEDRHWITILPFTVHCQPS